MVYYLDSDSDSTLFNHGGPSSTIGGTFWDKSGQHIAIYFILYIKSAAHWYNIKLSFKIAEFVFMSNIP